MKPKSDKLASEQMKGLGDSRRNPSATTVNVPLSKALNYHLCGQRYRMRLAALLRLVLAN